jgi:hypothetical protein
MLEREAARISQRWEQVWDAATRMAFEGCCGTKLGGDAPEGDVACDEMMDAPTKREGGGCGVGGGGLLVVLVRVNLVGACVCWPVVNCAEKTG